MTPCHLRSDCWQSFQHHRRQNPHSAMTEMVQRREAAVRNGENIYASSKHWMFLTMEMVYESLKSSTIKGNFNFIVTVSIPHDCVPPSFSMIFLHFSISWSAKTIFRKEKIQVLWKSETILMLAVNVSVSIQIKAIQKWAEHKVNRTGRKKRRERVRLLELNERVKKRRGKGKREIDTRLRLRVDRTQGLGLEARRRVLGNS